MGMMDVVLEDSNPNHVDWVERACLAGSLGRPHMDTILVSGKLRRRMRKWRCSSHRMAAQLCCCPASSAELDQAC